MATVAGLRTAVRPGAGLDVPGEVHECLDLALPGMRRAASAAGQVLRPPVLVMGAFERVGSNWFTARLGRDVAVYNEPLRQQLNSLHPLSTRNPAPEASPAWADPAARALGCHWLSAFVLSKYDVRPAVLKETNLLFSTRPLLQLFPDSDLVLLGRSVVGIVGSFQREELFARWDYGHRYLQLAHMVRHPDRSRWGFVLPQGRPTPQEMLTRMIFLNAALLAEATQPMIQPAPSSRRVLLTSYEAAVRFSDSSRAELDAFAPGLLDEESDQTLRPRPGSTLVADSTFSPYRSRSRLTVALSPQQIHDVYGLLEELLAAAGDLVAAPVVERARQLVGRPLHGDYEPAPEPSQSPSAHRIQLVKHRVHRGSVKPSVARYIPIPDLSLRCRNHLITNREFCTFLNTLRAVGVPNVVGGVHLFFNEEMIAGRGGRIVFETDQGTYRIIPGFDEHPVYWVTWLGAALYARHTAARLPTRDELLDVMAAIPRRPGTENTDFRVGDVVPVAEPMAPADRIHHLRGNLQVWCADGPAPTDTAAPLERRFFAGSAWSTIGDEVDLTRAKSRHLLGSSRSIGIRLVRDTMSPAESLSIETIRCRMTKALQGVRTAGHGHYAADRALADLVGPGTALRPASVRAGVEQR